jgi:hypothetical protein
MQKNVEMILHSQLSAVVDWKVRMPFHSHKEHRLHIKLLICVPI